MRVIICGDKIYHLNLNNGSMVKEFVFEHGCERR
jgi:hypothetical protein